MDLHRLGIIESVPEGDEKEGLSAMDSYRFITSTLLLIGLGVLAACGGNGHEGGLTKVQRDKVVYISAVPFEPPILYQQGGEKVGPDAVLADRIVRKIEGNLEGFAEGTLRSVWLNRNYSTVLDSVKSGEAQFAIGGLAVTEERQQQVAFSKTYYNSELVVVINPAQNDIEIGQLADSRIGIRGSTGVEGFVRSQYPSSEIRAFGTLDDAVLSLRRAEIDAIVDDRYLAAFALATVPGADNMEILPEPLGTLECAVAIQQGNNQLLQLVNEAIDEMESEYASVLEEHAGETFERVAERRTGRQERARQAVAPRRVTIRVSKQASFDFDIYRFANLTFVLRNRETGQSYNTSRIDFNGSVGVAGTSVPPGSYMLSLPRFNFSAPLQITSSDPSAVTVNITITSETVLVRKS